jgi:hypothetical protein
MRRGSWIIWPVIIDIRVGTPVETAGMRAEDRDRLIAAVRTEIQSLIRGERV